MRMSVVIFAVFVAALLLVRFWHLDADFPNHSFWSFEGGKYSDEGWYLNAAMNSVLMGHWYLPGDFAPAVVVPAWPLLMAGVFHITGVSVVAARATEAVFSIIALFLGYTLFRRYSSTLPSACFVLIVAGSACAYAYSRLALLERPIEALMFICLWLSCTIRTNSRLRPALLGLSIAILLLIKTTGGFLLPSILYPIWFRYRNDRRQLFRTLIVAGTVAGGLLIAYVVFFASHYPADIATFIGANEARLNWFDSSRQSLRTLYRGTWADPVLWPLACVAMLASAWIRTLWSNVLWGVCVLWVLGYFAFIVYHYNGPTHYFTMFVYPIAMISILFVVEILQFSGRAGWIMIAIVIASFSWNIWKVSEFTFHPEYSMRRAADQILQIVDANPGSHRLIIGHGANETTLYNGIPSIDTWLGYAGTGRKMEIYQPGWVLVWGDESVPDVGPTRRLEPVLNVPAFDDEVRGHLSLFQVKESAPPNSAVH